MRRIIIFFSILFSAMFTSAQDGYIGTAPSLAYWTVGDKKETVIVLHGGPSAAHNYLRPEWDTLAAVAKVVYYDQRGSGKSGYADCYSWQMHVEDLKKVVEVFKKKGEKVILAGSSWGTQLALLYAYTHPSDIKAMILSGTVGWRGKGVKNRDCKAYNYRFSPYYRQGMDTFRRYQFMDKQQVIKVPANPDSAFYRIIKGRKYFEGNSVSLMETINSLTDSPTLDDLKKIKMPVLIFQDKGYCNVPSFQKDAAEQYSHLPGAQMFDIPGGCHDPWYTHRSSFFQKCINFIKGLD